MGRIRTHIALTLLALAAAGLAGCGGGTTPAPPPQTLKVTPAISSIEQGGLVQFIVTNQNGGTVTSPVNWIIDNPNALSIAQNGIACAGSWDSLTTPALCTPGAAGVVNVSAGLSGATSNTVKVFVHQHVDRVDVTPVGPQQSCLSSEGTNKYQALFFSFVGNQTVDITQTVGPISWSAANTNVVNLSPSAAGLLANQAQATAKAPGRTQIFASAGNAVSPAVDFITCPVKSITIAVTGGGNSLTFAKGSTGHTVDVTVTDTAGVVLINPPITWFSTDPTVVTATASTSSTPLTAGTSGGATIGGSQAGGGAISAACIPPNCNSGFPAPPPEISATSVYSSNSIGVTVTGAAVASTVYVSSTACTGKLGCTSAILPVNTSTGAVGTPINLPHAPNSMLISANGNRLALGNDGLGLGLMTVDSAGAVTTFGNVIGKVIGIAANGSRVAVSDNSTSQGRVFIVDPTNSAATPLQLLINNATVAEFSPDNLVVYIGAQDGKLYSFDTVRSLRSVTTVTAPVSDIVFHPTAGFVYAASGSSGSIAVRNTCDNSAASTINAGSTPQFLHAVPDAASLVGATASGLEQIAVSAAGAGCPLTHSSGAVTQINFGQGSFTPLNLLIPSEGSAAYVLPSNLPSVLAYNFVSQAKPSIGLAGGQPPIAGGITADGTELFVTAADPAKAGNFQLHRIDTNLLFDAQQIQIMDVADTAAKNICGGTLTNVTCTPDLVAIKP